MESHFVDQSKVFDETDEDQIEVDVDDDEEEDETLFDYTMNIDFVDYVPLPSSHVYRPPEHMTNLNLEEDEPSSNIFYRQYM